jgi:Protein of unknown function (DUF1566)
MKLLGMTVLWALTSIATALAADPTPKLPYTLVDTGQRTIFSDRSQLLLAPSPADAYFGQDGFYETSSPSYRDNGDGTITDLSTGLMWVKARGAKTPWNDAMAGAAKCQVGGHTDWRAPTIKELYSLISFTGAFRMSAAASTPYLDTRYFGFAYGDESKGERGIDCQDWSATPYLGTTMGGNATVFGVNFADGRIKGYPRDQGPRGVARMYIRYVRDNPDYGKNDFTDNGDDTITDRATGLMWSKADSAQGMDWKAALAWVQARNQENYLGHNDWRLPNAKELQSIVDYTRAPEAPDASHRGPAIDPLFHTTRLADGDYPFFWTGTTHLDGPPDRQGAAAVYIAFGRATGWMRPRSEQQGPPDQQGPTGRPGPRGGRMGPGQQRQQGPMQRQGGQGEYRLMDVHGAGAQRSDPKSGSASDFPHGRGPQGDVIRIDNFVRLVRSIDPATARLVQPDLTPLPVPQISGMPGQGDGPPDFVGRPDGNFPPPPPPPGMGQRGRLRR